MEITYTKNQLLGRTDIQGHISFEKTTPTNAQVQQGIATKLKADSALVVVKSVHTRYGQKIADISAVSYDSVEAMQHMEVMTKHLRKKKEEQRKEAAEKATQDAAAKKEAEAAKEAVKKEAEAAKEAAKMEADTAKEVAKKEAEDAEKEPTVKDAVAPAKEDS